MTNRMDNARARIPNSVDLDDAIAALNRILGTDLEPFRHVFSGPVVALVEKDGKVAEGKPMMLTGFGSPVHQIEMQVAHGGQDAMRALAAEFGGTYNPSNTTDEWEEVPAAGPRP